jgi:hypothetical protein
MLRIVMLSLTVAISVLQVANGQSPQSSRELPRTAEAVTSAFVDLTLRAEFPGSGPALTVTRWEKPITWTIVGHAPENVSQEVADALARASALSHGKIRARYLAATVLRPESAQHASKDAPLNDERGRHVAVHFDSVNAEKPIVTTYFSSDRILVWAANLTVYYGDRIFLSKIAEVLPGQGKAQAEALRGGAADCIAYTWTAARTKDIAHATIVITNQLQRSALTKCIWEEVGQVLGIRNDFQDVDFSVFTNNTDGPLARWTAFDEAVIRTLYDSELGVGMNEDRVRIIVQQLASKYFSLLQE